MILADFFNSSHFFFVFLTLITYEAGFMLKEKFKFAVFNPMMISIILSVVVILVFKIPLSDYRKGTEFISFLLTPATVCLAIPLYEQFQKLRQNWFAILLGIISGTLTSMTLIFVFSLLFGFEKNEYIALLPKSVTTPIGMALSKDFGGIPAITVAVIVITGIIGAIFSPLILKLFRITDPVAKGVAIGTSSHALGTSKAMEMGEIEGAMSGLSVAVAGLITVILFSFYTQI